MNTSELPGPHRFVIPLTKIDVERRLVIGTAAEESVDKAKEIMDYESAKQAFQEWSDAAYERTGGLSKGNLRAMHDPKSSSGVVQELDFNDNNKKIQVCAKVVDDNDWRKCLAGVFSGFSIGGGYAKKWADPLLKGVTRYTPRIAEISLVDAPCMPGARFCELVKADGVVEQLELRGRQPDPVEIETFGALWKAHQTPAPTFGELWKRHEAPEPMTFGELMKNSPNGQSRNLNGKFSSGKGVDMTAGARFATAPVGISGGLLGLARQFSGQKKCPTCGQKMPAAS